VDTLEERVEDLESKSAGETEDGTEETAEASEAEAEKTEEDLTEAAEEAVKSILGLDDLPDDPEERQAVVRKGLVEAEDGAEEVQTIGFTEEDIEGAIQ
jgi:hypothetical protein